MDRLYILDMPLGSILQAGWLDFGLTLSFQVIALPAQHLGSKI